MPRGGARPGAGRKKGATQKRTAEIANKAAASGEIMPLEIMLETMRRLWAKEKDTEACAIAEKAAPYLHPRLAAVEHSGSMNLTYEEALAALNESDTASTRDADGSAGELPPVRH